MTLLNRFKGLSRLEKILIMLGFPIVVLGLTFFTFVDAVGKLLHLPGYEDQK